MMAHRSLAIALATLQAAAPVFGQQQPWRIHGSPSLILGAGDSDTTQLFEAVVAATRLPNGGIVVFDRGAFSIHLFSPEGRHLKALGRRGSGPGEIRYLGRAWRCGDSLVAYDIDGHRASVFSLQGEFVRFFRFGSAEIGGQVPYHSACNARGTFIHFGWGDYREAKPPTYRPSVGFWTSRADSSIERRLGSFPGSERAVRVHQGRIVGTSPLRFGRQTDVAIGNDRIYLGVAERFEILVFSLTGQRLASIHKTGARPAPVTRADIAAARERALASAPPSRRQALEAEYTDYPYPREFPPYAALRVDAHDNLWVQEYPRPSSPAVTWTVFSAQGRQLGEVSLPRDLDVFEIGADYILGRYLDPDEAVPQVRLYRLVR